MEKELGVNIKRTIKIERNGELVETMEIDPTLTYVGMAEVAGLLLTDVGGTAFDYIAIGEGTPSGAGATALGNEYLREAGTGTRITTAQTNDTAVLESTFSIGKDCTITEDGVFNAASAGTLLCYGTFSLPVKNGDTLKSRWEIQIKETT